MEFEKTKSSYIKGTNYNKEKKELRVKFKDETIWKYFDYPEAGYAAMLLSESVGRFFRDEIRGKFAGRKVEPEE